MYVATIYFTRRYLTMSFSIRSKKITASLMALTMLTAATAAAESNFISKIIPTNSISASAATVQTSADGKWKYEITSTYTCKVTKYLGHETTVIVPEAIDSHTVNAFGAGAFKDNGTIRSLTIPRGIGSVPSEFCMNCSNLRYMTLSPGVQTIGARAFKNTSSLISFYIPLGLTTVGDNAFENSNISSFTFPYPISGTRTIGSNAFLNAHNLTEVTLPGAWNIKADAFSGTPLVNIDTPESNLTYAFSHHAFRGAYNLNKLNGFQIWAVKAGQPYIHQWIRTYVTPYESTLRADNVKMYMTYYEAYQNWLNSHH